MPSIARFAVAAAVITLAGCPPQQPYGYSQPYAQPPQDPQQSPAQPYAQPPVAQGGTASCWDVMQCMQPCGVDVPCQTACQHRGDATAQTQVNALIDCSVRCNSDNNCVRTQCSAEIQVCRGGYAPAVAQNPAPQTGGLPQPHSTENLLPWLVGVWQSSTYQFTFNTDGTVLRTLGVYLHGGCANTIAASGPVRQEGDVLIMDLGAEDARICGGKADGGGPKRVRYRIEWAAYGGTELQLQLRDLDCDRGDLYCLERMTRR